MKVLVISDSHGSLENVVKVMEKEGGFDRVIHLGDIISQDKTLKEICKCPITIVKGNCDFYSENNIEEIVSIGNNRIFATHGHRFNVEWNIDTLYFAAQERNCNIAMYGHTHVPEVVRRGVTTIVNPGSISRPRQLDRRPSYVIMEIGKEGEADFMINYL